MNKFSARIKNGEPGAILVAVICVVVIVAAGAFVWHNVRSHPQIGAEATHVLTQDAAVTSPEASGNCVPTMQKITIAINQYASRDTGAGITITYRLKSDPVMTPQGKGYLLTYMLIQHRVEFTGQQIGNDDPYGPVTATLQPTSAGGWLLQGERIDGMPVIKC